MKIGKLNTKYIASHGSRFEGKFYLNEYAYNSMILERHQGSCVRLGDLAEAFNPPVFKRQFCEKRGNSIAYYQSSDITTLQESDVYIFKGQAEKLNLTVHEGDILIAGFGTVIGDTCIAMNYHEGTCFANNVCRVRTFDGVRKGYVAAVLKSKFGKSQLNNNASGSAIRYIEAPRIKQIFIPVFSESLQVKIDELIYESILLREKATAALKEAKQLIIDFCGVPFEKNGGRFLGEVSSLRLIRSLNVRFDASVFINDGVNWIQHLNKETILLGDCKIKTWYPGMFKRSYVQNGYPYIKGSELFLTDPFRKCEQLSRSRTPKLDELWLKQGQLLISCAGACGLVKLITKEFEEKQAIGSPDIIRLESEDELFTKEYLFTYLQIPAIYDYMQSLKYGSVIERFDIGNIETIPIVKPTPELSLAVTKIIQEYSDYSYKAYKAEDKAIQMVEEEIEKWNN